MPLTHGTQGTKNRSLEVEDEEADGEGRKKYWKTIHIIRTTSVKHFISISVVSTSVLHFIYLTRT